MHIFRSSKTRCKMGCRCEIGCKSASFDIWITALLFKLSTSKNSILKALASKHLDKIDFFFGNFGSPLSLGGPDRLSRKVDFVERGRKAENSTAKSRAKRRAKIASPKWGLMSHRLGKGALECRFARTNIFYLNGKFEKVQIYLFHKT